MGNQSATHVHTLPSSTFASKLGLIFFNFKLCAEFSPFKYLYLNVFLDQSQYVDPSNLKHFVMFLITRFVSLLPSAIRFLFLIGIILSFQTDVRASSQKGSVNMHLAPVSLDTSLYKTNKKSALPKMSYLFHKTLNIRPCFHTKTYFSR